MFNRIKVEKNIEMFQVKAPKLPAREKGMIMDIINSDESKVRIND